MKSASLDWPDCLNVRDLGGLPTVDGRQIAGGALIRSDNLTRLTEAGIKIVRDIRFGRIVDVRSAWECEHFPSLFAGESLHCNRPLARPAGDPYDPALSLEENYVISLDLNPDLFAAAVEAIASAPAGGVVVHCHAGKDRSGTVVALALSVAGVSAEAIANDYAAVSDQMLTHFAELLTAVADPTELQRLAEELSSRPATMIAVLDHLEAKYDSVEGYLRRVGSALMPSAASDPGCSIRPRNRMAAPPPTCHRRTPPRPLLGAPGRGSATDMSCSQRPGCICRTHCVDDRTIRAYRRRSFLGACLARRVRAAARLHR